jgi:hypothetical protein
MSYTTKYHLAEQILRRISEYNVSRNLEIDMREVWLRMDQLTNEWANLNILRDMQYDGGEVSPFYLTVFYDLPVETDVRSIMPYVTLPAIPVQLPYNKGVNRIWQDGNLGLTENEFIYTTASQRPSHDLASDMPNKTGYFLQANKAYFRKPVAGTVNMALCVANAESIDENAPYPIPADKQREMIDQVVLFFAGSHVSSQPVSQP